MSSVQNALAQLFTERGWSVSHEVPSPLADRFVLTAENDVAVVFAASATPTELARVAAQASGAIGALMQSAGGPKAWEAYLLLAVHQIDEVDEDSLVSVQRDLTFCRKIVLDADAIVGSADPVGYLEDRLALLFPLVGVDTAQSPSARSLLEQRLKEQGHPLEIVQELIQKLDDPKFDAVAFMLSRSSSEA